MTTMPGLRTFSLAARGHGGVSCDADGVFVGDVALLQRLKIGGAGAHWHVRPIDELEAELTAIYRLPIDTARKANALRLIAMALNRGDLALAAIATVQMRFPDPPPLAKGAETDREIARRALELHRSGLLKFWDPAKHPRAGEPPNPGWFAPINGDESESAPVVPAAMRPTRPGFNPWDFRPDIVEGSGGGGGNRGGAQFEFSFPRFWSRPTITEVPAEPPSAPPRPSAPPATQPELPYPEGLPTQRAPRPATENDVEGIPARGGRLGNAATRAQNAEIAKDLEEKEGLKVTNGDDVGKEEYIEGEGPGTTGATFVDITAKDPNTGRTVRVQTVDTLSDGETPTPREQDAIRRILQARPSDELRIIPKRQKP
jgi:hypothetical protein